jgi:hypothetical protein
MKITTIITAIIIACGITAGCKLFGAVALPWPLILAPVAIPTLLLAVVAIAIATRFAAGRFAAGWKAGTAKPFPRR